ncbi:MAG: acetolactate synthase small subunit [Phycisphaeraceae bacterium]|nr:acetolactate synthase small subunit [Phycisphaeraceae bacterium]
MNENSELPMRHVIAALVTNEPGVLSRVAGMFAARGFNIDSLVVGRTENPQISRMTIVVNGDAAVLDQVRKQLQKLVEVVRVVDYQGVAFIERDLILIQVSTQSQSGDASGNRDKLTSLANLFRARVVDVSEDRLMIEMSGTEEKIEAFVDLVRGYGIIEMARTGVIAMPRGNPSPPWLRRTVRMAHADADSSAADAAHRIDPSSLPPG